MLAYGIARRFASFPCVVLAATLLSACGGAAPPDRASVSATVRPPTMRDFSAQPAEPTRQTIAQVRVVARRAVWLWTQDMSGMGREAVLVSADTGDHWTDVTPSDLARQTLGAVITGLDAVDGVHAWLIVGGVASGSRQVLLATTDAGRHWRARGPLPGIGCDIRFLNPSLGWCIYSAAAAGSESIHIYRTIDFDTANQGWALFTCAGDARMLYRSTDAGTTWRPVVLTPLRTTSGAAAGLGFSGVPVLTGQAGAVPLTIDQPRQTVIYRTTDGGRSWTPVTPPGLRGGWLSDLLTPSAWRLINGNQLLLTNDAGKTWQQIGMHHDFGDLAAGFGVPATGVLTFLDTTTALINQNGLWRTTNSGRDWHKLDVPGT